MRDALRVDEGSVPEGYTLTELLLLARSSLANHRALALRMLADILRRARPSRLSFIKPEPVELHELVPTPAAPAPTPVGSTPTMLSDLVGCSTTKTRSAATVYWRNVWQYAEHDLPVAPHLRLALDDDCAPVVAAAAGALAALLCPANADAAEEEAADCCPQTGRFGRWEETRDRLEARDLILPADRSGETRDLDFTPILK